MSSNALFGLVTSAAEPLFVWRRRLRRSAPPPLKRDHTAMILGLVPDTRTAAERCDIGDSTQGVCLADRGHRSPHLFEHQLDTTTAARRRRWN